MRIKKESIIKTHKYNNNWKESNVLVETIIQYHYDSKDEKMNHKKEMESKGFDDSGQVKDNIGTITNPNHIWFGMYYKCEIVHSKLK